MQEMFTGFTLHRFVTLNTFYYVKKEEKKKIERNKKIKTSEMELGHDLFFFQYASKDTDVPRPRHVFSCSVCVCVRMNGWGVCMGVYVRASPQYTP